MRLESKLTQIQDINLIKKYKILYLRNNLQKQQIITEPHLQQVRKILLKIPNHN